MLPRLAALLITCFLTVGCTTDRWADTIFPPDQQSARLAYKRLSNHGSIEPVLEEGQRFENWHFYVASTTENVIGNEPEGTYLTLEDGSGILYLVFTTSDRVENELRIGTAGLASGEVTKMIRDLEARTITATLAIDDWREVRM